jgi:hypothetical protein
MRQGRPFDRAQLLGIVAAPNLFPFALHSVVTTPSHALRDVGFKGGINDGQRSAP